MFLPPNGKAIEDELTEYLVERRDIVLSISSILLGKNTNVHSFHGKVGGKNNILTDSINTQFSSFDDFLARWLSQLCSYAAKKEFERSPSDKLSSLSAREIILLLQNLTVRDYIFKFLERNFYRQYFARVRAKPLESIWSIWFGQNEQKWGLLLSPTYREGHWTNDVSEIRCAKYNYWTIGHVLSTGLIDPENKKSYNFCDLDSLTTFYESILKRNSCSPYERKIADLYLNYLFDSLDPNSEPFLIPEFRYGGLESKHKYRLDYTIFNPYTMQKIGFEISPSSTHYAMSGVKTRTQSAINTDLSKKWNKEMSKRNEYFSQFGITTVTFVDSQLSEINECFKSIQFYLSARSSKTYDLSEEIERLANMAKK